MYIKKLRNIYYAHEEIPVELRAKLGRARFKKTLGTSDRREAERRAVLWKLRWQTDIEKARRGTSSDILAQDARWWRERLAQADTEDEKAFVLDEIINRASDLKVAHYESYGVFTGSDPRIHELPEPEEANRFYAVATGQNVGFSDYLQAYLAALMEGNTQKTIDQKRSTIEAAAERWSLVQDIRKREVQQWVEELREKGLSKASVQRKLSELRGYWGWLQRREIVPEDHQPFDRIRIPDSRQDCSRQAFTARQVVELLHAAEARGDSQLADLIRLGMWTGGRIEALCALKADDVELERGALTFREDKTQAGRRTIPLHSKLRPTVERLVQHSGDGFVLSGLAVNKYGDRSSAIGKRFGRLKKEQGFGSGHVFHSIRKTVVTLLRNADTPEHVAAAIVGHDIPTMTYGLYGRDLDLETMRGAIERIDYPEDRRARTVTTPR